MSFTYNPVECVHTHTHTHISHTDSVLLVTLTDRIKQVREKLKKKCLENMSQKEKVLNILMRVQAAAAVMTVLADYSLI